jgi:hypothetical protein
MVRNVSRIGDRSGSPVSQGTYDESAGTANSIFIVVPSFGRGGLHGICSQGSWVAANVPPASVTLDYDIGETEGR